MKKADELTRNDINLIQDRFIHYYTTSVAYTVNRDEGQAYLIRIWYNAIRDFALGEEFKKSRDSSQDTE
jgi:hypothetical protein